MSEVDTSPALARRHFALARVEREALADGV
jgi:hypothetical protein